MIITLEEAKMINQKLTQDDLDAMEHSIRELTNNSFQIKAIRFKDLTFVDKTIQTSELIIGVKSGDTIQVSNSTLNDGVYTVLEVNEHHIVIDGELYPFEDEEAFFTLVKYPADIKVGVKKLFEWDVAMADKIGLKSRTVSRMSESYFDQTAETTLNGYPISLMAFLDKYNKMRWS